MRVNARRRVSRDQAIKIAMQVNGISRGMAERYTDSELKEVLRLVKLIPAF